MNDVELRLRTTLHHVASRVPVEEGATPANELQPSSSRRRRLVRVAAVFLLALALGAAIRVRDHTTSPVGAPSSAMYVSADGRFYDRDFDEVGKLHLGAGNSYISDISADGRVLLVTDREATVTMDCCRPDREVIYVTDLKGRRQRRLIEGVHDTSASWSPDGRKVLLVRRGLFGRPREGFDGEPGIYIHDLDSRTTRPFRLSEDFFQASWSPDGTIVAIRNFSDTILLINAETGAMTHRIDDAQGRFHFSPDGTKLVYSRMLRNIGTTEGNIGGIELELVVYHLPTAVATPIPGTKTQSSFAKAWGPDGIVVSLNRGGGRSIMAVVSEKSLSFRVVRHCSQTPCPELAFALPGR